MIALLFALFIVWHLWQNKKEDDQWKMTGDFEPQPENN